MNPSGHFFVTFDPLDGSAVVDSNFSVSSIFSIWEAKSYENQCGRDLVGAALAVYGSRTTLILYNTQNKKVEQLTLLKMGRKERWLVTSPELKI